MAQTNLTNATRETLTGNRVGVNLIADAGGGVTRDVLTGNRVGLDLIADIGGGVVREVLTGNRVGQSIYAEVQGVGRDVLTGDRVGKNVYADVLSVVREVLIKEPPIRAMHTSREVLVSMLNENLSVQRTISGFQQTVLVPRPPMALPSTVKSARDVATYREQVVLGAVRPWARSTDFAAGLRMQVIAHRNFTAAPLMISAITMSVMRMLVVRSRGKAYAPVSEVRVGGERQQVVQRRDFTPTKQVRTEIRVGGLVQQFVASRARQVVVITTTASVYQHRQQVVQASGKLAPHSEIDAAYLVAMAVLRRTVVPPNSGENVMQQVAQAVQKRVPAAPFGSDRAATFSQQVVQHRAYDPVQSYRIVPGMAQLAVLHRATYSPANIIGRHAATLAQQILMDRTDLVMHHSFTTVGSLSLAFVMGRTTPKPWDVIDPSIGRHVGGLAQMSVVHRDTIPPLTVITHSRYAYNVLAQAVVGDVFPLPDYPVVIHETDVMAVQQQVVMADNHDWSPVSSVRAQQVVGQVVVTDGEGWLDPLVPQSDVSVSGLVQSVVVLDTFPGSMVPQSEAQVAALVETVALGDSTMPDPMIPQSEAHAALVVEFAALGDAQFPNPLIPSSEIRSSLVGAVLALGDLSLRGTFGGSEIQAMTLAEQVVMSDRSLVGIPLRGGPRPIVSASMS